MTSELTAAREAMLLMDAENAWLRAGVESAEALNRVWYSLAGNDHERKIMDEIERLRAALAVVADPANWGDRTSWKVNKQAYPFIWSGTGEYADPMQWAASFLRDHAKDTSN